MKSRWLVVALVASLTLNVAAFGAYAYHRYVIWRHQQTFFRNLKTGARGRLTALFREMEPKMDSLRREHWEARRQLGELGFEENPDPQRVEQLLDMIARTHREMNYRVYETTRAVESLYPAERREKIRRRLLEMWQGPQGHGPRRRGFPRGRMMPPGFPPEPPPGEGR